MSDEPKLSQRYRSLGREEPPREIDQAIRAAAHRAVDARPAPLVVPTGRQRWYFPLAAAAVIVLAVAVTIHVEREQPAEEVASAAADRPQLEQAKPVEEAPKPAPPPAPARKPAPAPERGAAPAAPELQKSQVPQAAPPAQRDELARAESERRSSRSAEEAQRRMQPATVGPRQDAALAASAGFAAASPEQWLQGIADLKRQGRHEEAEKSLAEFRKRYPDYRIPEAILQKFEK